MNEPNDGELFSADVAFNGSTICGIACRVFFFEKIEEKPRILLYLPPDKATCLNKVFDCSFSAHRTGFDANYRKSIVAPHAFPVTTKTSGYGTPLSETVVTLGFDELRIFETWDSEPDQESSTLVSFFISKNDLLWPLMADEHSLNGSIVARRYGEIKLPCKKDISVSFEPVFRHKDIGKAEFIRRARLVGSVELQAPLGQAIAQRDEILSEIDDFLLIASLLERRRIVCFGWETFVGRNSESFYRGNYCRESSASDDKFNPLVSRPHLNDFLQACFHNFQLLNNREAVRHAIYSVVPLISPVLETGFLQLFSGLEALILDYKRANNLEFVVNMDTWKEVRKRVEKSIKDSTSDLLTSNQRCAMYKKLPELNRVSLEAGFDAFCEEFATDLSDLWPVFGDGRTVGLVDIRNKLIHGDPLPRRLFSCLVLAETHLVTVLNRLLIRILGCDPEITSVSKKSIANIEFKVSLTTAQSMLSDYLSSKRSLDRPQSS